MTKAELIDRIQQIGRLSSRAQAARALEDVLEAVAQGLCEEERVQILGFGTFQLRLRAARQGRNPKTGEAMQIEAGRSVAFKAGKGLKDRVQEGA